MNALPSQKTIGIKVVAGTTTRPADGGFWDVRARADGGFDAFGRLVYGTPQMRSGAQGVVLWGEPETRWGRTSNQAGHGGAQHQCAYAGS